MSHEVSPPTEREIRSALTIRLRAQYDESTQATLLEEFSIARGQVRADVVLVNGLIHGFEIKSERDSTRRLPAQIRHYGRVLDRATLVSSERHLSRATRMLPVWWGIWTVHSGPPGVRFREVRKGSRNPSRDARSLAELLWMGEALSFLEERGGARGVRGQPRRVLWERICSLYELKEVAALVRASIKRRGSKPAGRQP